MSEKQNCWEFMKCGRERGGAKEQELGVCPAVTDVSSHGLNDGENGGRICWAIAGTFCGDEVQGSFIEKQSTCMSCDVYKQVKEEQGSTHFKLMKPGQKFKSHV